MKKAFTLIELLVVIAIIAILAAILFPVFAQAKLAAKKTADLSNLKQIAAAAYMYYNDYDDTLFPYRINNVPNPLGADPNVGNPTGGRTCDGSASSNRLFWDEELNPYIKSYDVFKGPGVNNAWAGVNPQGASIGPSNTSAGGCSYGGQNSYGVNRIVFNADQAAMTNSVLAEPANTLIITDASYYDMMPKMSGHDGTNGWAPLGQFIGDPAQIQYFLTTNYDCGYYNYWVQLGGSTCDAAGSLTEPETPAQDQAYVNLIGQRNGGVLNAAFADCHVKGLQATRVIYDLVDNGNNLTSFWDPWKQGVR